MAPEEEYALPGPRPITHRGYTRAEKAAHEAQLLGELGQDRKFEGLIPGRTMGLALVSNNNRSVLTSVVGATRAKGLHPVALVAVLQKRTHNEEGEKVC